MLGTRVKSLFNVLIFLFVVQIALIAGLIGYLSYTNGRTSVNDLATQLMEEIGRRIQDNLFSYMRNNEEITRMNASLVQAGMLDPGDPVAVKQLFWDQLHNYPLASTVALGTARRDFIALERDQDSFILREYDKNSNDFISYRLDTKGQKNISDRFARRLGSAERSTRRSVLFQGKPGRVLEPPCDVAQRHGQAGVDGNLYQAHT